MITAFELHQAGHSADAARCYHSLLAEQPDHADALHLFGVLHYENGYFARAIELIGRAVALQPETALYHANLAEAHRSLGQHQQAIDCCRTALRLRQAYPEAANNLGLALHALGRFAEAVAQFRAALELRADFALARNNLGTSLHELGQLGGSSPGVSRRGRARSQLAPGPQQPRRNAGGSGRSRGGPDALSGGRPPPAAIAGRARQPGQRLPCPGTLERSAGGLRRGPPRGACRAPAPPWSSRCSPVIVGCMAPANWAWPTRNSCPYPSYSGRPDQMLPCLEALDAAAVRQLTRRHRDGLEALLRTLPADGAGPAKDRIVDKLPDNYLYLGLVALLFPRATFIHVRRDLRNVAVSCWMNDFRTIRWTNDREHLAGRCRVYARLMQYWHTVLPVPVHEVVYEHLVDDFETEARRLLAACGLEWEPACGRFYQTVRPVQTASVTQVRQSLYRRSLARWKHYEPTLADLFARLPVE